MVRRFLLQIIFSFTETISVKKIFTLLFFTVSINSQAQDWSPFNLKEKFNYQCDTASIISASYFTDSVNVINSDSVFYLNRIVVPFTDTIASIALRNQPQHWEKEMVKKQNGNYQFRNPGNKSLLTLSSLNDTWLFDTVQNISATIITTSIENILSNSDSVKTILLSNGDTIKLSKHYGLVKFMLNDTAMLYENLVGINGRSVGDTLPSLLDIFDFEIGDMFSFSFYASGWFGSGDAGYTNEKILSKNIISTDSVIYTAQVHTYIQYFGAPPPGYSVSDYLKTYRFGKGNYYWMNDFAPHCFYNSQNLTTQQYHDYYWINLGGGLLDMSLTIGINNRKSYTSNFSGYYDSEIGDTIFQWNTLEPPFRNFTYTEGLGLTAISSTGFESGGNNYVSRDLHLSGYIKGTETYGVIQSAESLKQSAIKILPTLCSDKLFVQNVFSPTIISVQDIYGRLRVENKISGNSNIDISALPSGAYIVQINDGANIFYQKIIKQ